MSFTIDYLSHSLLIILSSVSQSVFRSVGPPVRPSVRQTDRQTDGSILCVGSEKGCIDSVYKTVNPCEAAIAHGKRVFPVIGGS